MEHVIYVAMKKHLEVNSILISNQFGFRKCYFYESQLFVTGDNICNKGNK